MSAETALRAALAADAGVMALVGDRIVADRMEEGVSRPFVVFSRTSTTAEIDLSTNAQLGAAVQLELQVWADSRASAEAVANACDAAIRAAGESVLSRASGYDAELDVEAVILNVEWWE